MEQLKPETTKKFNYCNKEAQAEYLFLLGRNRSFSKHYKRNKLLVVIHRESKNWKKRHFGTANCNQKTLECITHYVLVAVRKFFLIAFPIKNRLISKFFFYKRLDLCRNLEARRFIQEAMALFSSFLFLGGTDPLVLFICCRFMTCGICQKNGLYIYVFELLFLHTYNLEIFKKRLKRHLSNCEALFIEKMMDLDFCIAS